MRKYNVQVWLYARYFVKVMLDNVSVLLYTVGLPILFLGLNLNGYFFKTVSLVQYTKLVLPFVAWIIVANTMMMVSEVALLREQGYLKQYASLVVNPSVFIISKAVVNLMLVGIILGLVAVVSTFMFRVAVVAVLWRLWSVLLLVSVPIWGYCLPILSFRLRYQTVSGVINVVTLAVMIGSVAIGHALHLTLTNITANLLSPVYLVMNCFSVLVTGDWHNFLPGYLVACLGLGLVGWVSYRHLQLLPTEGL